MYNEKFFKGIRNSSYVSAKEIVPIILKIFKPKSVIDLGCATGAWLKVFTELGIEKIVGVDGSYVDYNELEIPKENFITHDLSKEFKYNKKFDLAISLEVAEHLPEASAEIFVKSLTNLSDIIVFSAAVPNQGGTHHINEQWPEFWIDIFKRNNFTVFDCIRKRIWNNKYISWYYAQNIFVYVRNNCINQYEELLSESNENKMYSVIHPRFYLTSIENYSFGNLIKLIPRTFKFEFKRIINKIKKSN